MSITERYGLKENPYTTSPIRRDNLSLFVGRREQRKLCISGLSNKGIVVIEGDRGVGTTSLGNFVRFSCHEEYAYFTPDSEISVSPGWNSEILLANVLSTLVWSIEEYNPETKHNSEFLEIKRATHQVRETFRNVSLQLSVLGTGAGGGAGKQAIVTTPSLYPVTTLTQYLRQISQIVQKMDSRRDIIIQLDNIDLVTIFSSSQLKFFLNDIRDILQIEGFSWILVGDTGLRNFIASEVDRLDDIVTLEVYVEPLILKEVFEAITRRVKAYSFHEVAKTPLTNELVKILYNVSGGRIRQIFGIASRLLHLTEDNPLIDKIDIEIAKPILRKVIEDRIRHYSISHKERIVLESLIVSEPQNPNNLAKVLRMPRSNVSRALAHLREARLVSFEKSGREHKYEPLPEVKIAYFE